MALGKNEVWAAVREERLRLADDLGRIAPADWERASLCPGWSIHDVLAHLLDTARTGRASFVRSMIVARGDFDRANADGIAWRKDPDPARTLAEFRASADLRRTPPANLATRLVEAIVHGEDVRRPLGISGDYPAPAVRGALDYQLRTRVSFGGGAERAAGLRLVSADSGAARGAGSEVRGTELDLLVAVSGRPVPVAAFDGPGAELLAARSAQSSIQ